MNKRNKNAGGGKRPNKVKSSKVVKIPRPIANPQATGWDQLLRDPCAAELVRPCYAGTESGYLARTVDFFTLTVGSGADLVVGSTVKADYMFAVTPSFATNATGTFSAGYVSPAGPATIVTGGLANFITTNALVRGQRVVAACLKWVPTGPTLVRQGMIGIGYSTNNSLPQGSIGPTFPNFMASSLEKASNGSTAHECRWLPTLNDESYRTQISANGSAGTLSGGSLQFAALGVDATATAVRTAVLNGYLELTICWEWVPNTDAGMQVAPSPPTRSSTHDILSSIKDMGAYLLRGVRSPVGRAITDVVRRGAFMALGGPVSQPSVRPPALRWAR